MSAVITDVTRVQNARSFYSGYFPSAGSSNNVLYICFGKDTAWGNDTNGKTEDDSGFLVPIPDAVTADDEFRGDLIVGKKIAATEFTPVINRVDWGVGNTYNSGDVVITDEMNVYIANQTINSSTKPTHTSGKINGWEFLYKISNSTYINNFVTNEWIPVYYNGNVGEDGSPDLEAFYKTRCKNIMVSVTLSDSVISTSLLNDFRKIALWTNPLDANENFVTFDQIDSTNIDTNTGLILYVDHRLPVYRDVYQVEEYKIILGF